MAVLTAAWLLAGASGAAAQEPIYRCAGRNGVTYSQLPCTGGRQLGVAAPRHTDKSRPPPQDRAKLARRAQLSPEGRKECSALDVTLREQAAALKAKGEAATIQDETPLVKSKLRFRELRC
jgi:hypothetical protein